MNLHRRVNLLGLAVATLLAVAGCVTTTTGSVPQAADIDVRVAAQLGLARGYLEQRDLKRAQGPLEKALELDPSSPEANALQALFYDLRGDIALAEEHFQRALAGGGSARIRNNYGAFLARHNRLDSAYRQLQLAADDPDYTGRARAYENLGLVALKLDRPDAAREALGRALGLNPRLARATLELALLAQAAGDSVSAGQLYERYRRLGEPNARSLALGIQLARARGDSDAEASHVMSLRNLYPDSAEYRQYQAGGL